MVLLGNFGVEDQWAADEPGLPRIAVSATREIAHRMDEFCLLLAGAQDHVLLKSTPDDGHLAHLAALGFELPRVLTPALQDPDRTVTEDVLADPALLKEIGSLPGSPLLWPHGVSEREELLAESAGLPLACPSARICKTVNGKAYSRRIADELGLRQAQGWICRTVSELHSAAAGAGHLLDRGGTVVMKDSYGVSGKGLLVLSDRSALERVVRKIARRGERTGDDRVNMVVETWVAKKTDLNYQFTIDRAGNCTFDFVREAVTEGGVHKGHRIPARLDSDQGAELAEASRRIGARLHADGYVGAVGVDAMVDPDGGLYPIVEINARNNMSTYQERVRERLIPGGRVALATQYPLTLSVHLPFDCLADRLRDTLMTPESPEGLLVSNFATVNAAEHRLLADGREAFDGRLYGIVVADSDDRLTALDQQIAAHITAITEENGHGH
ncbi:preATP grasp domain-containing protein [Streptomyces marianii]|uniref:ATP-grasp domain-containing protein n=1 Tax=Streptomyces marianii TaxID=1817406 RepID=A0A5R9EHI1_9ACTN|nr:ATP-grasp domain-containing protein [Streptomyces marianii]TLQ48725.1 ATP-grasp domain-containing protein [Streptomyces marianii]